MREIKEGEEDEEESLVVKAFAVCSSNDSKNKTISLSTQEDPESICIELSQDKDKQYMEIIDFDEHFNDISLDWTNPQFDE